MPAPESGGEGAVHGEERKFSSAGNLRLVPLGQAEGKGWSSRAVVLCAGDTGGSE